MAQSNLRQFLKWFGLGLSTTSLILAASLKLEYPKVALDLALNMVRMSLLTGVLGMICGVFAMSYWQGRVAVAMCALAFLILLSGIPSAYH